MSIQIDRTKCVGCGQCAEICPGTLIRMTQKKAEMRYPMECWGCASCVKECPAHAISLYLGADIGGAGCRMTVNKRRQFAALDCQPTGCVGGDHYRR